MKRDTLIMLAVLAAGAYFILRRLRDEAVTAVVPAGGFTKVPSFTLGPQHAGAELQRATGSVLPSGAARELIR